MGDVVNMNVEAVVRAWAGVERDRIAVILAEIEEVRAARAALPDDELSESGEYLALVRLDDAEERLLTLILDPGFARYQRHLLKGLTDFAVGGA